MAPATPTDTQVPRKKSKKKAKTKQQQPAEGAIGEPPPTPTDAVEHEEPVVESEPPTPRMDTTEPLQVQDAPASSNSPKETMPEPTQPNGHKDRQSINGTSTTAQSTTTAAAPSNNGAGQVSDTSARLEAMSQDREALRTEVEQLRRQLESIQQAHSTETTQLKTDLQDTEAAKDQAETQYQTLLGRVEKIKETLGDRLKRDRAELEEANQRIEELESQNEDLRGNGQTSSEELERLQDELKESTQELANFKSRSSLTQQNSNKEKEDMARQVTAFRAELESTSNAMREWENIAMEERSVRGSLSEKVADLEEQLYNVRDNGTRAAEERDSSLQTIDNLQRALQEIQDARRKELRALVESSEEQSAELKKRVEVADKAASEAEAARESMAKELERTAPFEKEVREKNLLVGKLRHEAIVLNDHLTKALRYLKKTKPEDQVDKQIVSNYFIQFLALDRSDAKKFQILQVIAGYLSWTEEQRETAGLARPGSATSTNASSSLSAIDTAASAAGAARTSTFGSLRLPTSPFHRTPSTPSLGGEFFTDPTPTSASTTHGGGGGGGRESLADLWAGFLERSVEEAGNGKKGSVSSVSGESSARRKDSEASSSRGSGVSGVTITRPEPKT